MKYLAPLLVAVCIFGCAKEEADNGSTASPDYSAPTVQGNPSDQASLDRLKTDYEKAKTAYQANPAEKKAYVDATVKYATAAMQGPGEPKVKYPLALDLYGEALKADPSNAEAAQNRQMILDIYASMKRTPPKR